MDIKKFGVKNFRCFRNYTDIEIKPINIFVGKNSSGKSSLARLFPLLRQSSETKTKGPILWFGQDVDFGSFETTRSNGSDDKDIHLNFDLKLTPSNSRHRLRRGISLS